MSPNVPSTQELPHRLGPADARQKKERSGGFLTAELERRFPIAELLTDKLATKIGRLEIAPPFSWKQKRQVHHA